MRDVELAVAKTDLVVVVLALTKLECRSEVPHPANHVKRSVCRGKRVFVPGYHSVIQVFRSSTWGTYFGIPV